MKELPSLVVELKEEAERLRAIRECEWEIIWWSDSLKCQKEGCLAYGPPERGGFPVKIRQT